MNQGDSVALERFLVARGLLDAGEAFTVRPIGDGHANLTYLASDGARSVVVRRPPPPPLPPGANDVLREARTMAAVGAAAATRAAAAPSADEPRATAEPPVAGTTLLAAARIAVPEVLATAEAGEALDVPFFVMTYVAGPVITTGAPASLAAPDDRADFTWALVDGLAALHALDWTTLGLRGRPEGSNLRQVQRMARLVADPGGIDAGVAAPGGIPPAAFAPVEEWLLAHVPPESGAALLHGDYRLGNVVAHPTLPRVAAVLDWELATVGDPLVDLGYLVASWADVDAPRPLTPLQELGSATAVDGFPTAPGLLSRYLAVSGRTPRDIGWYLTLANYKLAALYEYSRRRYEQSHGDEYYADPALVARFLAAARRDAGLDGG